MDYLSTLSIYDYYYYYDYCLYYNCCYCLFLFSRWGSCKWTAEWILGLLGFFFFCVFSVSLQFYWFPLEGRIPYVDQKPETRTRLALNRVVTWSAFSRCYRRPRLLRGSCSRHTHKHTHTHKKKHSGVHTSPVHLAQLWFPVCVALLLVVFVS